MFDRIFLPALAFVVLVAATAAFAIDATRQAAPLHYRQSVVQLERVVIVARHEAATPAPAIAAATPAEDRTTALR